MNPKEIAELWLISDLLDYSDDSGVTWAVIVFLYIYQTFVTMEHPFLYQVLECFASGDNFISVGNATYIYIYIDR